MIGENKNKLKKEYGDYQTPQFFCDEICTYIKEFLDFNPNVIFEPTFGIGNFIFSSIKVFDNIEKIFGIEINSKYYKLAQETLSSRFDNKEIHLYNSDIFKFDFSKIKSRINKTDNLLILGNPPWVTNSELSVLDSNNIPVKTNFKNVSGLDAITGKGNFDITEYIILNLVSNFQDTSASIAMLCKSTAARNIVKKFKKLKLKIKNIKIIEFNAKKIFDVDCDAVLLYIQTGASLAQNCDVYSLDTNGKIKTFGWYNNKFISNIEHYSKYSSFDGECQFVWRQGIKHDCAKIFELFLNKEHRYTNGNNEILEIEDNYVYPLFKSSDLKDYLITKNRKNVIVTQKKTNQNTDIIKDNAPKLWQYLIKNEKLLNNRKSIIYRNSPKFSIFGIGDYSFSKYKVAVSGFYKEPVFSLINTEKSAMLDDTCYFISFNNFKHAQICTILLNSRPVKEFLKSLVFSDAKRPYTKEILMRIDFNKICEQINYENLIKYAETLNITNNISEHDYYDFINIISKNETQLKMFTAK